MKREKEKYSIQAVDNALDVIEQFKGEKAELGITELSKNLEMQKNNVFRILATLEARGYVEQNKNSELYRLGIKALELGKAFLSHTGLIRVAQTYLRALQEQVNETVYLGILREGQVFYVEGVESTQALRVGSRIGTRLSPLCTAIGKAMLAFMEEEERAQIIEENEFCAHTPNSLKDAADFEEALKEVRAQGYALDMEEKDMGVVGVAAPIRNYNNEIVASISIVGPMTRMTKEALITNLIPNLQVQANALSAAIGYTGEAG